MAFSGMGLFGDIFAQHYHKALKRSLIPNGRRSLLLDNLLKKRCFSHPFHYGRKNSITSQYGLVFFLCGNSSIAQV